LPFLRISRDRRGYEYYSLVHSPSTRRGKPQQETLYWFRTPPNLKVGRAPLDDDVRRALEAKYPNVTFDWDALASTPMPPPSAEYWRERRRADKALRQQGAADEQEAGLGEEQAPEPPEPTEDNQPVAALADEFSETIAVVSETIAGVSETIAGVDVTAFTSETSPSAEVAGEAIRETAPPVAGEQRRRRRRRRRRSRSSPLPVQAGAEIPATQPDPSSIPAEIQEDEPDEDEGTED